MFFFKLGSDLHYWPKPIVFVGLFSLFTQDVIWTSIQLLLKVMDVSWTSKQRCVFTGAYLKLPTSKQLAGFKPCILNKENSLKNKNMQLR